jgi:predicted outer membrane repeat protein
VANSGTAIILDDILYGDVNGEIVSNGTITATFSDIAQASGVYPGNSNLNADPLFTRIPSLNGAIPNYGDLHLQNGSPDLAAGVTIGNSSDLDGFNRSNPPSIGAYEFPVGGVTLLTVTNTADSVTQSLSGSLRATLQAAANQSNVIVQFAPGVTGVIQLQGSLPTLVSGLTIHGPGAGSLVVDGGGKYRLFHVSAPGAPTSISGLTLQNGSDKGDLGGGGAVAVDSGSALTLTACALRGNRAAYLGGAIYSQGTLTVLGSVFSGNSAGSQGAGVYNGGAATLVGDTFSGGSAPSGGGVSSTGTATLTDDILYGDTGGEIANFNTITVTYSDVGLPASASVYPGTGNLNSDPLFVRAPNTGLVPPDYGDLHLRLGSPAAFAGTVVSGNAKDIAGLLRPATPSLGAYDQSLVRVLYNRADGTASIATFHGSLLYARADYGPYPGWTARALAEGPNGSPRLLWNNTDGRVALWNLSDPNPGATAFYYGSYPGWAAVALAVGPDSAAHLLWDNTDGRLALWNTTDPNPGATAFYYGPYPGWSGTAISFGPDNHERLLWDNTSGQVAVWNLSDANPPATAVMAGPYNGWMAKTLTVSADNAAHLLWDNVSGQVAVWNLSDPNPPVSALVAGPYSGWLGQDLNAAPDGTLRLLWDNVSGSTSLWNLNDPNPVATYQLFAPLGTSIAVSLATGP